MTHKKHEIAVFIENEEMLQQARELLDKYGEEITDEDKDWQCLEDEDNYLSFDSGCWAVYDAFLRHETLITLPQLEEILKNK